MDTHSKTTARAYWTVGPGVGEIREEQLVAPPHLAGDDLAAAVAPAVLVRTLATALSRGTESLVHRGEVPMGEAERMRAPFQGGDFPFPVKYGYMAVGEVEEGPEELVGRAVFCLHPHQDRFWAPVDSVYAVPDETPSARAVLAANMETAINVSWDAEPHVGDRIAVVGAGVIGLLVSYLMVRIPGCDVTVIDPGEAQRNAAQALGVRAAATASEAGLAAGGCDLVVHASGTEGGLRTALNLAGPEARVVEASWHGAQDVSIPLGGAFHSQRIDLRSSQVGSIPPHQVKRWDYRRRMDLALRLLQPSALDVLITSADPFNEIAAKLPERLACPDTLCATFRYS